jgi:hypothetical protein
MARLIILQHLQVTALACPPPHVLSELLRNSPASEVDPLLDELNARRRESVTALQESGLWESMTSAERAFLTMPAQNVSGEAHRDVSWLMEASECLLWALGLVKELPPFDTQASVEHLTLFPSGTVDELRASASLRDRGEIATARSVAELWHWRSRTRQLLESGSEVSLPQGLSVSDVVQLAAGEAASRGDLPGVVDGDFPLFGRSYAQASPEEWAQATSIAFERHRALNWLSGYGPKNRWGDTPTDT